MRLPFQIPTAACELGKPKLLHVVSSPRDVIQVSTDYRGWKKWLAVRFAEHSERTMRRWWRNRHTRTVTNGVQMWKRLGCVEGQIAVSSCLKQSEMIPR